MLSEAYSQEAGKSLIQLKYRRAGVLSVEGIQWGYCIDGKSIRCIARKRHHDRRTVRRFLGDAGPPRYTLKVARRRQILDSYWAVINQWLKEDQDRPPMLFNPPRSCPVTHILPMLVDDLHNQYLVLDDAHIPGLR